MKNLKQSILEKLIINKHSNVKKYYYHPKTRDELKELVDKLIKERGDNANLNDIDTSEITNMYKLFYGLRFNGDISNWNVSNVKDMDCMFKNSMFSGDISKWNVNKAKQKHNILNMFDNSPLEENPPKWYKN